MRHPVTEATNPEVMQEWAETLAWLDRCLHISLTPRQRRILNARYALGRTLSDIGKELGISSSRVRQIEVVALDRLRMRARAAGITLTH